MTGVIQAVIPGVIVGVMLAVFNRKMNRRDKANQKRAEEAGHLAAARKEESLLSLDLQMANAKMSYAVAMALKRGHANGEVEEGIHAYEQAKQKYVDFLNRQATEHLTP